MKHMTRFTLSLAGALLIAALVLAGPAIARRLKDAEAALRPTLFVSALERPG